MTLSFSSGLRVNRKNAAFMGPPRLRSFVSTSVLHIIVQVLTFNVQFRCAPNYNTEAGDLHSARTPYEL